jgi:ubiquinone/menaquinone biosynthesis C-methylase UbiE
MLQFRPAAETQSKVQTLFRRIFFQYFYFRQPPWDTGISPPELLEFIEEHEPGCAIDLGCGTGTNVITLARAGWQVTGVDFAPRAIKLARQKLDKAGVRAELLVRDATQLQGVQGPFDLAFDVGCFHSIPPDPRRRYLDQLDRILAKRGFWLMYAFLKPSPQGGSPGLSEADLGLISSQLTLLSRRDGFERGERASAWFLFQKE